MDRPHRPRDTNLLAKRIVYIATGETQETAPNKAQGQRKGGLKGGPARAASLTPERRSEIAKQAAAARWNG
ncbi:MAG: histone H1 [Alphaproteobacteria bacterium]|nr:histone H1 [Alphaproteobacteria bacterium]